MEDRHLRDNKPVGDHLRTMLAIWPKMDSRDRKDERLKGHLRTVGEIRTVCAAVTERGCNLEDGEELRDKILFALMTGLRHEELLRVRFRWIEEAPAGAPVAGVLRLPDEASKTESGGGTLGLAPLAMEIVRRRYAGDPNETLFKIKRHKTQLKRISADLGIKPAFKLRDMRTTHLTWAKERVGIDAAQAAGRHMSPRTTMTYIREHALNLDALAAASAVGLRFDEESAAQNANQQRLLLAPPVGSEAMEPSEEPGRRLARRR